MNITRREACRILGVGLIASTGVFATGCNQSEEGLSPTEARDALKNSMSETTLSQELNKGRSLWFYADVDNAQKDGRFSKLLVFDGGAVTDYGNAGVTFGDLDGLSEDAIIELVNETAATSHANKINDEVGKLETSISSSEEVIAGFEQEVGTIPKTDEELERAIIGNPDKADLLYDAYIQSGYIRDSIDTDRSKLKIWKAASSYQTPEPTAYSLHIKTDKTGNASETEEIAWEYQGFDTMNEETFGQYVARKSSISLAGSTSFTVYNTEFSGYGDKGNDKMLVMVTSSPNIVFLLDEPGVNGVEVD